MNNDHCVGKNQVGYLIVAIMLVGILSFSLVSCISGTKNEQSKVPPLSGKAQANINVAFKGVSVIIRNDNHFDWTNTRITLANGNKLFHVQAGTISKGETKGFIMSDFVSDQGEPFNYKNTKIDAVSISSNEAEAQVQVNH